MSIKGENPLTVKVFQASKCVRLMVCKCSQVAQCNQFPKGTRSPSQAFKPLRSQSAQAFKPPLFPTSRLCEARVFCNRSTYRNATLCKRAGCKFRQCHQWERLLLFPHLCNPKVANFQTFIHKCICVYGYCPC